MSTFHLWQTISFKYVFNELLKYIRTVIPGEWANVNERTDEPTRELNEWINGMNECDCKHEQPKQIFKSKLMKFIGISLENFEMNKL